MNDELHRHLDRLEGSRTGDGHRPEEHLAWERLLDAFRVEMRPPTAPPWLEDRIMAEVEALPEPGILTRAKDWLLRPRPVRVSPLTLGLAGAAVVAAIAVGVIGREEAVPSPDSRTTPGSATMATSDAGRQDEGWVYVQFVLEAPGARSVAVAGDFDAWEASYELQDLDGDGVWTGRVPVRPGVHAYMFLVDGSTWITDPRAERYADDGFGNRNAILAVAAPTT